MKKLYTLLAFLAMSNLLNAQTNLIPNAGFESWTAGIPDSWFASATTVTQNSTNVYSGSSSVAFTTPATGNRTISPATDIPVTQGVTYVFSGWYFDNEPNSRFKYWNQFRTAAGTTGTDTGANMLQATDFSTDAPTWRFFTAEAMPNATATVARTGLRVYPETGTTGGGLIYLDDVKFYDKSTLLSVSKLEFDNQIKMASVVTDNLTIQMPTRATVNIYTIDGKLFSSNRVNSNESINTQSMTAGVYIVTIQNDYAKTSRKIIKQ